MKNIFTFKSNIFHVTIQIILNISFFIVHNKISCIFVMKILNVIVQFQKVQIKQFFSLNGTGFGFYNKMLL